MLTVRKEDEEPQQPYYTGNVQLMEARFLELSSSIRALYKSNQDLEEALQESPGDPDFIQAILENQGIIVKQRKELFEVVKGMQQLGADTEVPDDIQTMNVMKVGNITTEEPTADEQHGQAAAATASQSSGAANENPTTSAGDEGVYL